MRYDRNGSRNWILSQPNEWNLPGDSAISVYRADGLFGGVPDDPDMHVYDGLGRLVAKRAYMDTDMQYELIYDGANVLGVRTGLGLTEFLSGPGTDDALVAYLPGTGYSCPRCSSARSSEGRRVLAVMHTEREGAIRLIFAREMTRNEKGNNEEFRS